jgi:uncharacterized membrane protein
VRDAGTAALVAATIAMGLAAGLFYAFSCAVMPGLRRADDRTIVSTMQNINVAILNGWFALSFGGAPILTAIAAAFHFGADERPVLPWIVAAFVLYGATLVITFRLSIPLNNALDAAGDPDQADLPAARRQYEAAWVRWNNLRTLTSTAAFACLVWAVLQHGNLSG